MKVVAFTIFQSLFILMLVTFTACDKNEVIPDQTMNISGNLKGTGSFVYASFAPLSNKPTTVYYHIPTNTTTSSSILMVFHGAGRDALEHRDALIAKAEQKGILVIVPEFSQANFPGGDGYNLGNVFIDGDNPSANSLNPEGEWAFSLIEPLFDQVKQLTGNTSATYHAFGFSAGAQFAHRLLFFKPAARLNKIVAASSGWFTMLDDQTDFPYGIKESPIQESSFGSLFSKKLTVLIGEADNDPNFPGLRRNSIVDVQGTNRLARAQYFYNHSNQIASGANQTFNWQYISLPNVDHNFTVTAEYAMDQIF